MMLDFNILIAGAAGEGVQTIGGILSETLADCGYGVFSWQEFESRIRGGQSGYTMRVCAGIRNAPAYEADVVLALNEKALDHFRHRRKPGGLILCQGEKSPDEEVLAFPFTRLAEEWFGKKIYANVVATGVLAALLGVDEGALSKRIERRFDARDKAVAEANREAVERGYRLGVEQRGRAPGVELPCGGGNAQLLTGHEALALGSAWAGCRFIAAYPMSPSTSIITFFAQNQERLGVFVEQAEDEIAAANLAIGASFAGARAMTATSGGGFALMVEAVSLAGMTETPLIVVLAQRPGPATGLPTRTAQGDLLFAVRAGHGEFPKAVLAPADAGDAFTAAARAFDLADRFQIPAIVLTDQFLADSKFCLREFPPDIPRGEFHLADPDSVGTPYRRYRFTTDGVSPRLRPGQSRHLVCADSDEHDEEGHITEDLTGIVPAMAEKRRRKTEALRAAMAPPRWEGPPDARTVLVGWGSSREAIREALELLDKEGARAAMLHFTELWPPPRFEFPDGVRLVAVESNATGQFETLLASAYGVRCAGSIRRFDGLPLDAVTIAERFRELGK